MINPFRYFKTSPEVIRLAVMMYIRFPLSLRQVEDLLHEGDIDICHETVRVWWNRFGPMFAAQIRKKRSASLAGLLIAKSVRRGGEIAMQTAGSGPDSPSTAIFATLPVTASGHPGNLGLYIGFDALESTVSMSSRE